LYAEPSNFNEHHHCVMTRRKTRNIKGG